MLCKKKEKEANHKHQPLNVKVHRARLLRNPGMCGILYDFLRVKLLLNPFFWLVIYTLNTKTRALTGRTLKGSFNCIVLPDEDRWPTELFCIYNIHNDTAEFEHEIHLQKALLTLGKNSVSILFTRSQAVQPLDALGYHIFTIYVRSKAFIIVIITF